MSKCITGHEYLKYSTEVSMNYLQNHIWCSDSNWGNEFNCRHTVFFNCYEESDKQDWLAVINKEADSRKHEHGYTQKVINLKPEVLQWLEDNVQDVKRDHYDNGHLKAWCIGSLEYRANTSTGFSIFFLRRKDAMAFIKRWSQWKKPVSYCQYFTDIRKELDLKTLKYVTK